ncbi:hypothetical protein J1605_017864 [Eschrichtius robustus]|uniref:Uncharacterized protein n=1 Tax=Eschrichtius robustus TaxID=9764 RepID=A0AB34HWD0_ESCRO|nr:hypothetical protein J1605_017864 [Eschrichtius robustus]
MHCFCSEPGQRKQDWRRERSSSAEGENLLCALRGDGSLECKNVCLGPRGKGLRVRNRAARELKLQPFLSRGVRKVRCSQGCELSSLKRRRRRQRGLVSGPFAPRLLQPFTAAARRGSLLAASWRPQVRDTVRLKLQAAGWPGASG